tara:strand:+ start:13625 stop:13822 length:198 start_codon:yes stop_codon:yes gene_type:complete
MQETHTMARWKVAIAVIACLPLLAACHTDPFSIKPETNATVPKKAPAADPQAEPSDASESESPAQ